MGVQVKGEGESSLSHFTQTSAWPERKRGEMGEGDSGGGYAIYTYIWLLLLCVVCVCVCV